MLYLYIYNNRKYKYEKHVIEKTLHFMTNIERFEPHSRVKRLVKFFLKSSRTLVNLFLFISCNMTIMEYYIQANIWDSNNWNPFDLGFSWMFCSWKAVISKVNVVFLMYALQVMRFRDVPLPTTTRNLASKIVQDRKKLFGLTRKTRRHVRKNA